MGGPLLCNKSFLHLENGQYGIKTGRSRAVTSITHGLTTEASARSKEEMRVRLWAVCVGGTVPRARICDGAKWVFAYPFALPIRFHGSD
jgi:hypothetical protein